MMKIAIITWKFHNYGTVLQAFAMNYFLNQKPDIHCDLIDYDLEKKNLDIPKNYSPVKFINRIQNRLILEIERKRLNSVIASRKNAITEREKKFEAFIEEIPHTDKYDKATLYKLNEYYDVFICGSDQIWNPKFFDGRYMLDFVNGDKMKIAFSPSFGTTKIPKSLESLYKEKLSRLNAISVREDSGCKLVENLLCEKAYHLCDPTLLLSGKDWTEALEIGTRKDEYILCYFLSNNKWYINMVKKAKEQLHLPIKVIGVKELSYTIEDAEVIHPGPVEFVDYIANAKFVITDSFHGMLFSTNFNRPYIALQRFSEKSADSENGRLKSFMNAAKLEKRYYTFIDDINKECFEPLCEEQINYLECLRKESTDFLSRYIHLQ